MDKSDTLSKNYIMSGSTGDNKAFPRVTIQARNRRSRGVLRKWAYFRASTVVALAITSLTVYLSLRCWLSHMYLSPHTVQSQISVLAVQ